VKRGFPSAEVAVEVSDLDAIRYLPASVEKSTGGIRTENLCRHYEISGNPVGAVNGVCVEIESGEFAALLNMTPKVVALTPHET
jgi:hypothetical protein